MTTVYLHIGSAHAGSTSIQEFLRLNRERLGRRGVCYPVAGGSSPFAAATGSESAEDYRRDLAQEAAGATSVVISDERLWGRRLATAGQIAGLRDLFAPFRVVVVCYIRRQDELLLSQYARMVYKGHAEPFAVPTEPHELAGLDYHSRLIPWREAFGDVVVRRFGASYFKGGSLLADFTDACGVNPEGLEFPPVQNMSLDADKLEFLRRYNGLKPPSSIRGVVAYSLAESSGEGVAMGLERRQREAILSAFDASNSLLAQTLGLDRLFTHSVPDEPSRSPTLDETVAISAIALARAGEYLDLERVKAELYLTLPVQRRVQEFPVARAAPSSARSRPS